MFLSSLEYEPCWSEIQVYFGIFGWSTNAFTKNCDDGAKLISMGSG